jgi:hypothetical protein
MNMKKINKNKNIRIYVVRAHAFLCTDRYVIITVTVIIIVTIIISVIMIMMMMTMTMTKATRRVREKDPVRGRRTMTTHP